MPFTYPKTVRKNPLNDAKIRAQHIDEQTEREEKNEKMPLFELKGAWFRAYITRSGSTSIKGPFCPTNIGKKMCASPLHTDQSQPTKANCRVCENSFNLKYPIEEFREIAHDAYIGLKNSLAERVSLSLPFDAIKATSKQSNKEIKIAWSQHQGRDQAVIYLIEKNDKGNKVHLFADMTREEIRHDAVDLPPGEILAEISATFKNTSSKISYKNSKQKNSAA